MPETTVLAWKTPGGGAGGPPWLVERAVVIERAPGQKLRSPGATGPHSAGDGCAVRSLRLRVRRQGSFGGERGDGRHGLGAEPRSKTAAEARPKAAAEAASPRNATSTVASTSTAPVAVSAASSTYTHSRGRNSDEDSCTQLAASASRCPATGASQGLGAARGDAGTAAARGAARAGGSTRASQRTAEEVRRG
jgi:hypothetical protein